MDYKRLYRSETNIMLSGICGGIGEYFNIDPTLVRLGWGIVSIMNVGAGILAYVLAHFIIPRK